MNKNLYVSDALRLERERSELLAWKLQKAASLNGLLMIACGYLSGLCLLATWGGV
jgi:hypothetical protein